MSINLLLPEEDDPVIWRGPVISGVVTQFWTDVAWGELDYLFVDMPPGTGDVPLTVFQSLPVEGIVIVTSPQDLVRMIVKKAYNMAGQIAINPEVNDVEATTIEAQTEQVCKNLGEVLKEAGTSFDKVLKTTCFLADMSDFAAFNEVYGKYFTSKPARSCVAVKTLPKGVLCEVELIAAVEE